jgi:hypothetical protein
MRFDASLSESRIYGIHHKNNGSDFWQLVEECQSSLVHIPVVGADNVDLDA